MKSAAPSFIPSTASSIDPHAVSRITGTLASIARSCESSSSPSAPVVWREKFMSWMTSEGRSRRNAASASTGVLADDDRCPCCLSSSASDAVMDVSSSTIRIMDYS